MKEVVFQETFLNQIANRLTIPKSTVKKIWDKYTDYLIKKIDSGESVKFLNICYLRVNTKNLSKGEGVFETLAYIAHEVADVIGESQILVYRVLTSFEEYLILDLQNFYSYSIRGIVRIRLERYNGYYRVRTKKSTRYNGKDVYVTTIGTFKRKVEFAA